MMKFKKGLIKLLSVLMIGCISLPLFSQSMQADERVQQKKVRVGYMIYDGYQEGEEGETKSGSAYEYYQKIRYYTGWEYEYVYGSLNEMFEMLERGEIDIVSNVTYTEERAQKYLFSDEPHGSEASYLYAHENNKDINFGDLESLNGMTVGITRGSYQEYYFREWCIQKQINCEIVLYDYNEDLHEALNNEEIDIVMDVRVLERGEVAHPWKTVHRFPAAPLYLAISKDRPDLLEDLNKAQAQIIAIDEFYAYDLMEKYYDGTNYHNAHLTPEQQAYVDVADVLKVGYLEGTNPLSYTDPETGKMTGLAADYIEVISKAYGLKFDTIVYTDETQLIQDLRDAKLDIILPIGFGYWSAEQWNISLSSQITTLPMSVVFKGAQDEGIFNRIAVIESSATQKGFVELNYPDAEMVYVENTKAALEAIDKGQADCYFVRSSSIDYMNQKFQIYEKYHTLGLMQGMEAFMATRIEDTHLSIILDKGLTLITDAQKDVAKIKYSYPEAKVSLWEAVKDNLPLVVSFIFITILIYIVIVVVYRLRVEAAHNVKLQLEKERAEVAQQEAERAQHAKTDFLSQMSHDIRTPMNAVIGFTNFAKESDDLYQIHHEYIPKIETASNQLLMIINDVLEMSRIESGKMSFNRKVHDIKVLIESIATVMRIQAEEKDISLSLEVAVKDKYVYCDENHLNRVIMNLLSNAVKFTESGGSVMVSMVQVEAENPNEGAFIATIKDTGVGMSPEFLEKVFDPFEREHTSTVSRIQGTGIGMTIVKNILESAGNTISVESEPGKGTTFTICFKFPLASKEEVAEFDKLETNKKNYSLQELKDYFKGKRILLAEDNEFNSTIAETILENAGFIVETAGDGKVAVQKVMNAPTPYYYDVILMDIQMPVMNGYEATKTIRALADERADVKIIAVTANAFDSDKKDALAAGMNGHVAKPLDVNVLYSTLLEITDI